MFRLEKLKNWAHSSVADDKKELNVYQSFQDQFLAINSKIDDYLNEKSYEDERIQVDYNGKKIPINLLKTLSQSILSNKDLTTIQKAQKSAELTKLYYEKLRQLSEKIITLAVTEKDNVYLVYINSCIQIINSLLNEYSYLLAIQRSSIYQIDNQGELNAGEKLKVLKDNIEIRTAEINSRLALDRLKR